MLINISQSTEEHMASTNAAVDAFVFKKYLRRTSTIMFIHSFKIIKTKKRTL